MAANNANEVLDIVTLLDEDGQETAFEHILTFLYEGERYVALSPIEDDSDLNDDEAEVIMLKIEEREGEDAYVTIESEVLLNEVFDAFLDMMDEIAGDEQD